MISLDDESDVLHNADNLFFYTIHAFLMRIIKIILLHYITIYYTTKDKILIISGEIIHFIH